MTNHAAHVELENFKRLSSTSEKFEIYLWLPHWNMLKPVAPEISKVVVQDEILRLYTFIITRTE